MPRQIAILGRHIENGLGGLALLAMGLLPVLELGLRALTGGGLPGSVGYVQNLTLWVGFLGAIIASREGRHLNLSAGSLVVPGSLQPLAASLATIVSTMVGAGLFWASLGFVQSEMADPVRVGGWLPLWCVESVLPFSFLVITWRFIRHAGTTKQQILAALGIPLAAAVGWLLAPAAQVLLWPALIGLIIAAVLGAPIFVVLGGAALALFFADGVPVAAIPVETYRIVVSPSIPMIPLFTLTGFLLAEGGASRRLVRLFDALFGWLPGGLVIATTLVCAFFCHLYRCIGRGDPGARRAAVTHSLEGWVAGTVFARLGDGHRLNWLTLPTEPGHHPLWRRRARADPGSVHGGAGARRNHGRGGMPVRRVQIAQERRKTASL